MQWLIGECFGFGNQIGVLPGDDCGGDLRVRHGGVRDLDDLAKARDVCLGRGDGADEFGVDEQNRGSRMIEDVLELRSGETRVQGDQDSAGEWDGKMREQHLGNVRRQVCNAVTGLNALT